MRTLLVQDHATNMRDLLFNYHVFYNPIIDFTFGKGGLYEFEGSEKLNLTKCDANPTADNVLKRDLLKDDYSNLGPFNVGVADFPYLYDRESYDLRTEIKKGKNVVIDASKQGKNAWAHEGQLDRFTANFDENGKPSEQVFIDRVKALNEKAKQCILPSGYLFVKVMDCRHKGRLVTNHVHFINYLSDWVCHAIFVYFGGTPKTWKHHAQNVIGYWEIFVRKEFYTKPKKKTGQSALL